METNSAVLTFECCEKSYGEPIEMKSLRQYCCMVLFSFNIEGWVFNLPSLNETLTVDCFCRHEVFIQ